MHFAYFLMFVIHVFTLAFDAFCVLLHIALYYLSCSPPVLDTSILDWRDPLTSTLCIHTFARSPHYAYIISCLYYADLNACLLVAKLTQVEPWCVMSLVTGHWHHESWYMLHVACIVYIMLHVCIYVCHEHICHSISVWHLLRGVKHFENERFSCVACTLLN